MFRLFVAAFLLVGWMWAQPVRAPRAQALVDEMMDRHKEMQTVGVHLTPPGWRDNVNIACSKPGKVGKLSAELDLGVIRTGKHSMRRTEKGAFDIGLPLSDRQGRAVGMVVIVIRETAAADAGSAMKQATAIRDELQQRIGSAAELLRGAVLVATRAAMVAQTPLPFIKGRLGPFAVDVAHDRLFLGAGENGTFEVFNLAGGWLKSAPLAKARVLAYDPEDNALLVAGSGERYCSVLDAQDLHLKQRIPLTGEALTGVFDAGKRLFYIGGPDFVSVVSMMSAKEAATVPLSGNAAAMAIDRKAGRLYVALQGRREVSAIRLSDRRVERTWALPDDVSALTVDEERSRILAASGASGQLIVLDSKTGTVLRKESAVTGAKNLWFDVALRRVYCTGEGGLAIFAEQGGQFRLESRFATMKSAASIYVPERKQLYAVHGANAEDGAALQVYLMR